MSKCLSNKSSLSGSSLRRRVFFVFSLFLGAGQSAEGFNYNEHRLINQEAILLLPDDQPDKLRSKLDKTLRLELAILNEDTRINLGAPGELPTQQLMSAYDIPALAGDLATDPANLLRRFFSQNPPETFPQEPQQQTSEQHQQEGQIEELPDAIKERKGEIGLEKDPAAVDAANQTEVPTKPLSMKKDVPKLLKEASKISEICAKNPTKCGGDISTCTTSLVPLARKNLSHFNTLKWLGSIPRNGANEHVAEKYFHFYKANESCGEHNQKKQVFGAKETAVGYYLELHAAAIAFRAYSHGVAEQRELLEGLSLLFEQFALHYLNDLVAPGHHLRSTTYFNGFLRWAAHSFNNSHGRTFIPTQELCDFAKIHSALKSLFAYCWAPTTNGRVPIRIFGDGRAFSDASNDGRIYSFEVAEAAAAISLEEYVRLGNAPSTSAGMLIASFLHSLQEEVKNDKNFEYMACLRPPALSQPKWMWAKLSEAWLWAKIESSDMDKSKETKMKIIQQLWRDKAFAAIYALPMFTDEGN